MRWSFKTSGPIPEVITTLDVVSLPEPIKAAIGVAVTAFPERATVELECYGQVGETAGNFMVKATSPAPIRQS